MAELALGRYIQKCVLCRSSDIFSWKKKASSDRTLFNIVKCSSCGSGFINPRPSSLYLNSIYKYSGHGLSNPVQLDDILKKEKEYPNSTLDAQRVVDEATKLLKTRDNGKALDIGSGYGFYSASTLNAGFEVKAINPGEWENNVFEQLNNFRPIEDSIENINLLSKFDLVIMSQVLEHICNVDDVLKMVRSLMNENAVLFIAVSNINSFSVKILGTKDNCCLWVPEHLNYFSRKGLISVLKRNDFNLLKYHQISRIPCNFISKKMKFNSILKACSDNVIRILQKPILSIIDKIGLGLYHNIWVSKNAT